MDYRTNKLKTFFDIVSRINNWPTAAGLRIARHKIRGARLLSFRDGLQVICRSGTRDWDVIHELLFAGSYGRAFTFLRSCPGRPVVLDLGGNLGLFSLLASRVAPNANISAFEPGPPNARMFEINCLLNPSLSTNVKLTKAAVGGTTRKDMWRFDDENPGGSGLFASKGDQFEVQIVSFDEVLKSVDGQITLAKIDIEGAEYEILDKTPSEAWDRIQSISLELHDDPRSKVSQADFLAKMRDLGFTIEEESVCSFFLHR